MGQQDDRDKQGQEGLRTRRKFSPEFKRDAVDLVLTSGRPIAQVAKELGVYDLVSRELGSASRQAADRDPQGPRPSSRRRLAAGDRRRPNVTKPDETALPQIPDLVGRLFDPDDVDRHLGQ